MTIKKAGQAMMSYVTDKDELVGPSHQKLHFRSELNQKTFFGGLISLGIAIYVYYVAYKRGLQML